MKPLKFLKPIKIIIVPFSNRNKRSFLLPKESTTKKNGAIPAFAKPLG